MGARSVDPMHRRILPLLVLVSSLVACDAGAGEPRDDVAGDAVAENAPMDIPVEARQQAIEVMVELEVPDLDAFEDALEQRRSELGGHVEDAQVSGKRGTQRHGRWVVRVPAPEERAFAELLEQQGELLRYARTSEDVTDEVIDVEARLVARRAEERRLLALMDTETAELEDVLAVSKELSRVRGEIEEQEGRQARLSKRVAMPIITVLATEIPDFAPASAPTYSQRVSRTFHGSLDSGKAVIEALGLCLVALVPWLLPLLGAGLVVRLVLRRARV